jgi:hypothetical protein
MLHFDLADCLKWGSFCNERLVELGHIRALPTPARELAPR